MSVLVAQLGARRHYAVPIAFDQAGMLHRFCTDIYLDSVRVRRMLATGAGRLRWRAMGRLAGRGEGQLPPDLLRTFPLFGLEYKWSVRRARSAEARTAAWIRGGQRFCRLASREIDDQCRTLYAFTSVAKELFEVGRERGCHTCLDHSTAPRRAEMALVREESERFPGWARLGSDEDGLTDAYHARQRAELELADRVICGSSFVRRLVEAEGVPPERICTVPLGINPRLGHPKRGPAQASVLRVLFVGGDGLRKGIGYLGQALSHLDSRRFETRVAGDLEISEMALAELRVHMTLLGPVPRTNMEALFDWADVLVLPSVSDTFGLVILEAMAAGLPVITTPNTGGPDVLRDGADGFIVPIRDPEAIADRLERLMAESGLLSAMSENAIERVREFSITAYSERLVAASRPPSVTGAAPMSGFG